MAQPPQVVGSRQAGGAGADDEHAFAALSLGWGERPALLDRLVAEEALDRIDADRLVDLGAITGRFTGMVAHPPHHRRQRIVLCEQAPRGFIIAGFGMGQPALNVLASGAGVIARWQPVHINRPGRAPGTRVVGEARAAVERDGERVFHHASPSRSRR
jgi:hypothetical protein